ncbi:leucine-rich repeat domain-containing protein [Ralstonia pseudosolanacearum]
MPNFLRSLNPFHRSSGTSSADTRNEARVPAYATPMREAPARQPRSRGVFDRILHPRRSRASTQAAETPFASPMHPRISATPAGAVPGSPVNARHARAPSRSAPSSPFRMPGGLTPERATPGRTPSPTAASSQATFRAQAEFQLHEWEHAMEGELARFSPVSGMTYEHTTPADMLRQTAARLRNAVRQGPRDSNNSLIVQNAPVRYLPEVVTQFTHLQQIFLEDCDLHTLPGDIGNLTQLQKLSLTHHPNLRYLPDSLNNLGALQKLQLRNTGITELPRINRLSELKTLSVDETRLAAVPSGLSALRNLKHLTFSRTHISEVPPTISNLINLKTLTLSRNHHLQAVPASIGNLPELEELALNGCPQLRAVPDTIGNLRNLQKLYLHDCTQLRTLPESIANLMPHLRRLDLSGCVNLQRLPACLRNPPRHLNLTLPAHLQQTGSGGSSRGTPASQGNTPTASPPRFASPIRSNPPAAGHVPAVPAARAQQASPPSAAALQERLAPLRAQGGDARRIANWLSNAIEQSSSMARWNLGAPAFNERTAELIAALTTSGPNTAALHAALANELTENSIPTLNDLERTHIEHRRQTEGLDWKGFIALAVRQVRRSESGPMAQARALQAWPALQEFANQYDSEVKLLKVDMEQTSDKLTDLMLNSQTDMRASSERIRVLGDQLKHATERRLPTAYTRVANEWLDGGQQASESMQAALRNLVGTLAPGDLPRLGTAATALPIKLQDALSPLLAHNTGRELVQAIGEQACSVEVPKSLPSQLDGLAMQINRGMHQIQKMMDSDTTSSAQDKNAGLAMAIPATVKPLWEAALTDAAAIDAARAAAQRNG